MRTQAISFASCLVVIALPLFPQFNPLKKVGTKIKEYGLRYTEGAASSLRGGDPSPGRDKPKKLKDGETAEFQTPL